MCGSAERPLAVYHWEDFKGIIPVNGVRGGVDSSGRPTYVGQTYYEDIGLLPSVIYVGNPCGYAYAAGCLRASKNNVKILCSSRMNDLEWRKVNLSTLEEQHDHVPIPGGQELGTLLLIGRVSIENEVAIGKVTPCGKPWSGLEVCPKDGCYSIHTEDFEILGYPENLNVQIDPRSNF